jgi:hypothetical protein
VLFGVPQFGAATLPPGAWVWPVARHPDGRPPKISSGWGAERVATEAQDAHIHRGVDIMFRRPYEVPRSTYKPEHGSPWYEAPPGTPILAAYDGVVWSTGSGLLGKNVILDHGKPYATFYQHLEKVYVTKGQRVVAGQVIGLMGYGTIGSIRHLHFAVWQGGGESHAIDPQRWMETSWVMLDHPTVGIGPGANVANFRTWFSGTGPKIAGAGLLAVSLIAGAFAWRQHQERW